MSSNLRVTHGPPGTGKTTYLSTMAMDAARKYGPSKVLLASLTKAAAAEISSRKLALPKKCIGTLHSHAYQSLGCPDIAEAAGEELDDWEKRTGHHVVHIGKKEEIGDDDLAADRGEPTIYEAYNLCRAKLTPREKMPLSVQEFAKEWEEFKKLHDLIDFEDMIGHAHEETEHAPGNPHIIYIDEAQDHSASEFRLAIKWAGAAPGGAVIVGDTDQTIYAWRGADPEAFANLKVPAEHHRVLDQSYRVPRAVHALAQRIIRRVSKRDDVEYRPRDADGLVESFDDSSFKDPQSLIRETERLVTGSEETVMILGSCAYMLKGIIAGLRERGIPFHNPFRKRRGDWNPLKKTNVLLDFLKPEIKGGFWTWEELSRWVDLVKAKHLVRGRKSGLKRLAEKMGSLPIADDIVELEGVLMGLLKQGEALPPEGQTNRLRWLLDRTLASKAGPLRYPARVIEKRGAEAIVKRPQVTIGTIHSVKGGEADHVFLLPDLSTKSYVQVQESTEGKDSALRLFYVGATRARETLRILRPAKAKYQMEMF